MIDLSSYKEPYTRVKWLYVDEVNAQQRTYRIQWKWNYNKLISSIDHAQISMRTHSIESNYREWRIMQDAVGVEFYIYIDVDTVNVYRRCPKQLTMDLLRVV